MLARQFTDMAHRGTPLACVCGPNPNRIDTATQGTTVYTCDYNDRSDSNRFEMLRRLWAAAQIR